MTTETLNHYVDEIEETADHEIIEDLTDAELELIGNVDGYTS